MEATVKRIGNTQKRQSPVRASELRIPNQILRQARLDHSKTLLDMSEMLNVKFQRVHQWEQYNYHIPLSHIIRWATDDKLPAWMREAALQMWVAELQDDHAQRGQQLDRLQDAIEQICLQLRLAEAEAE